MRKRIGDETILKAALQCFSAYGYKKATLEDIARILGMTAAGLYAYADSKRALYEDTVRYALLRWQGAVAAAAEQVNTAEEKLNVLCNTAVSYLEKDEQFCALLQHDPSILPMFPTSDPYEDINNRSMQMIAEILQLGQQTGEFRTLDNVAVSEILFSIYKSFLIHAYVQKEEGYLAQYFSQAMELVTGGILYKCCT